MDTILPNASGGEIGGAIFNLAGFGFAFFNLVWCWLFWREEAGTTLLRSVVDAVSIKRARRQPSLLELLFFVIVLLMLYLVSTLFTFGLIDLVYMFIPAGVRVEIQVGQVVFLFGLFNIDLAAIAASFLIWLVRRRFRDLLRKQIAAAAAALGQRADAGGTKS